jgi:uncharacterized protein (TIRG00374 family)
MLTYLLLLSGIALLGGMMWQVGISGLRASLQVLSPWLVPFFLLDSFSTLLHTKGWSACFADDRRRLRLWQLILIRMAGSTINQVTPTADVGGEVVKVWLLQSAMSRTAATASVCIDKVSSALAQIIYLSGGMVLLMERLPMPIWVGKAAGLTLGGLTLGVVSFIALQRYGGLSKLAHVLSRFHVAELMLQRLRHRLLPLEAQWSTYYTTHPWRFVCSLGWHFLGFAFDACRTFILFRLLLGDQAPGLVDAVTVAVAVAALQQVFFFVPGNIGTLEGIRFMVLSTIGMSEVYGVAFGIVARLESLCWNGLGLLAYAICMRWPSLLSPSMPANSPRFATPK